MVGVSCTSFGLAEELCLLDELDGLQEFPGRVLPVNAPLRVLGVIITLLGVVSSIDNGEVLDEFKNFLATAVELICLLLPFPILRIRFCFLSNLDPGHAILSMLSVEQTVVKCDESPEREGNALDFVENASCLFKGKMSCCMI